MLPMVITTQCGDNNSKLHFENSGHRPLNDAHKQIRSMTLDSQKPSGFGPRDPEPEKALHRGSGGEDGGRGWRGGGLSLTHSRYVTFCGPCTSCCMYSDVQNAWSQGYPARVIQDGKTTINQRAVGVVREEGGSTRRVGFLGFDEPSARRLVVRHPAVD